MSRDFIPAVGTQHALAENAVPEGDAAASAVALNITQPYFEHINRLRILSVDEELAFARRMRQGENAARGALITHNLGLIVHVARRYLGRGLPLLELVEEGKLGLMHALEKFDPERGIRLSSYAIWWIRQAIDLALKEQSRTLRLPA
ncbi:MAG: sigma-70 family RNA polymerase sigma factor [Thiobacillus sp.]|nr:sigma-70 family RNA polymerase sigma factor [Thiobacillus sp.]